MQGAVSEATGSLLKEPPACGGSAGKLGMGTAMGAPDTMAPADEVSGWLFVALRASPPKF